MIDRLDEAYARYEALTAELARPEVAASPSQLERLGRELAQLEPLVRLHHAYRAVLARQAEAQALLASDDAELAALARAEWAEAEAALPELDERVRKALIPKDPDDDRSIILEVRAGAGGEEAALFASDLLRMYQRYAERHRLAWDPLSVSDTGIGGVKEAIVAVRGRNAFRQLKFESGVHRVQRIPVTESGGRIHTSTVTVAVLPEAEAVDDLDIPDQELRVEVFRSGGHGGQSVNTTDSAVRITHVPTKTVVSIQNERSQMQNKARAMEILRARLLHAKREAAAAERGEARRGQIGTGERSEKIRTFNFPQDRLTDHRIGLTVHNLPAILDGDLDRVIAALTEHVLADHLATATLSS
ncbi:MAG: peptide chain release factor 1 [Actinobacteria bacterium]|nr:peptide chain release factor 1 [Actinomycetota bacterium]